MVEARVLLREVDRHLADVDAAHVLGSARDGVEAKGADVAKAVEHAPPHRDLPHGAAIVFLVKEEARLLAVLEVERKGKAVFVHRDAGVGGRRTVPPALVERQAFLCPERCVVALVEGTHVLAVGLQTLEEKRVQRRTQQLHAVRTHLRDEHLLVPVDDKAWQPVDLAEDDATRAGVCWHGARGARAHGRHAMLPCILDAATPKGHVEAVVGVA